MIFADRDRTFKFLKLRLKVDFLLKIPIENQQICVYLSSMFNKKKKPEQFIQCIYYVYFNLALLVFYTCNIFEK